MDYYYRSVFFNRADSKKSCCHKEQYATAKQIMAEYTKSRRQVLLAAQMQSGKTGVYLALAIMMVMESLVERVFIICGSNDVKLHAQLAGGLINGKKQDGDIKTAINKYVKMLPADRKEAVAARLTAAIKAYKSSDLRSARTASITSDTLVIWDESHFAQNSKNWPARFLRRCGLSVGGTARGDAKWVEKRSFFLSVSATPFAEFSAKHMREKDIVVTRSIVIHEPADAYVGVMDFEEAGAILPAYRVEENKEEFTALLASYAAQKKYALIRSRNLDVVKACCRVAGVEYKNYYNGALELAGGDIKKALKDAPARFTVVGLKEMCRMGEVIPKEHIAFVFEEAKESKTDTLLQSLMGRMCGHSSNKEAFLEQIKIYVPECFTSVKPTDKYDISELNRYLKFTTEGIITPLKATCMGPKPKRSGELTLQPRWVPFDFSAESEDPVALGPRLARGGAGAPAVDDDSDDSDYEDEGDDSESDEEDYTPFRPTSTQRHNMCAAALAVLRAQPYADERQRTEAIANMTEAIANMTVGACEFHDINSGSYQYVRGIHAGDKKSPSIHEHLEKNDRWDDHWNEGRWFKFYMLKRTGRDGEFTNSYNQDGFYVVGYTTNGDAATVRECRNHIIPVNTTSAFHPDADLADDEVVHAFPLHVVRNDRDADAFFAQPVGAQRFVSISKEYAKTPRGRMIYDSLKAVTARASKTGPKLTKKKRANLGIPEDEEFDRFAMVPGVSFSIDIKGSDAGVAVTIKVSDSAGNIISDIKANFPAGTPFSFSMSMPAGPTVSVSA